MSAAPEVVDDKEQSRYEVHLGGETVAIADYVKAPDSISFTEFVTRHVDVFSRDRSTRSSPTISSG